MLVAQLREIARPVAIVLRVRLEDHPLDLIDETIGDTFCRAKLLDELLGQITGARKRHVAVGVTAVEPACHR